MICAICINVYSRTITTELRYSSVMNVEPFKVAVVLMSTVIFDDKFVKGNVCILAFCAQHHLLGYQFFAFHESFRRVVLIDENSSRFHLACFLQQ